MLYLSNNQMTYLKDQKQLAIPCQSVDLYKKNLEEIRQRKEWKSKGPGAQFMGMGYMPDMQQNNHIYPSDMVFTGQDQII